MTDLEAYIILNAVSGVGPRRARALIAHCGSAQDVLQARPQDLMGLCDVPEHAIINLTSFSKQQFLDHEMTLVKNAGVEVLCDGDRDYPPLLKEIADAPLVLYIKGRRSILQEPSIAVVGSRRASLYGLSVAQQFSMELAHSGINVVSGLARGIDTAAHQGALRVQGITTAVLGCGLSTIYPSENSSLAQAITHKGILVSEFPMQTPPASFNFPRRNRIISGLSQGVLVVEAAVKSGALITSDFALEQGRDVFAIPGKVGDLAAQGTNHLIQQGAKLVTSTQDILRELFGELKQFSSFENSEDIVVTQPDQLSIQEKQLYAHLKDDALHIDELADKSGMSVMQAALVLFKLELRRIVKQLPGQSYQKVK